MVNEVNTDTFENAVLHSEKPVAVELWAPWCGPCKVLGPIFEQVAQEYGEQVSFFKLNADENQELVRQYKVLGIPTVLYFRNGRLVDRKTGVEPAEKIAKRLPPLLTMTPEQAEKQEITGLFRWPFRKK